MKTSLSLSSDLTLPLSAVTETFGVLAVRGAGKSNLAAVMAEQMSDAGLPFVVVDPVGSWFGLRAGADGSKDGGLPIPIFGGKHGDVPLERHGGELLADLVVSKRLSCVIDLSAFDSEGSKKAFLLDFARRLYQKNEDPLHLFLEEADDYIPQRPMRDELQLLRAWENIVRRGRARGLGLTLITQRSASINKSVLTQIGTLFVLRTTGPQDRAAIEAWVKYHQTDDNVLASLAGLKDGEAWAWSPHFLGVMQRFHAHRRRTFDSGATPKNLRGKDARPAATLADVDLAAITQQMASTLERAKADDPRELRKQLAELRQQLQQAQRVQPSNAPSDSGKKQEVAVLTDADRAKLAELVDALKALRGDLSRTLSDVENSIMARMRGLIAEAGSRAVALVDGKSDYLSTRLDRPGLQRILEKLERVTVTLAPALTTHPRRELSTAAGTSSVVSAVPARLPGRSSHGARPAGEALPPGEHAVLTAAAQWVEGVSRDQLGVLTGYKRSSRDAHIARLLQRGLVDVSSGQVRATAEGVSALGPNFEPLPTGDALLTWWRGRLPEGERAVLDVLVIANGRPVTRESIDETTGYKRSSRDAYLARLSARKLVTSVGRGEVKASEELFG